MLRVPGPPPSIEALHPIHHFYYTLLVFHVTDMFTAPSGRFYLSALWWPRAWSFQQTLSNFISYQFSGRYHFPNGFYYFVRFPASIQMPRMVEGKTCCCFLSIPLKSAKSSESYPFGISTVIRFSTSRSGFSLTKFSFIIGRVGNKCVRFSQHFTLHSFSLLHPVWHMGIIQQDMDYSSTVTKISYPWNIGKLFLSSRPIRWLLYG